MNKGDKTIKYLVRALVEAGLIKCKNYRSARQHVQYWIKSGRLQLRQRAITRYYLVNDIEISDIIRAFSFGGEGFYHVKL
jgi:hypothetical protein